MSHREVADFFGRRRKPALVLTMSFADIKIQDAIYQFTLRFFLQNMGRAVAKYTRVTASFQNLEIVNVTRDFQRIDFLRGGMPSIQFDYIGGVLHATSKRTSIGDVGLKVKDNGNPITVSCDVVAEEMELFEDRYSFALDLLQKAKEKIVRGEEATLVHAPGK
jgi:hypothetical protein